jgi:hypothetical protein
MQRVLATSLAVTTLLACASGTAFADTAANLDAAISLCTSLPHPSEIVTEALVAAGWASDPNAVRRSFVSSAFAFRLQPEDIAYSIDNGVFMAASILGNSGLPPDQPGFSAAGIGLVVVQGGDAPGYCVLSGPDVLLTYLQSAAALEQTGASDLQTTSQGSISGHDVQVVLLDRAALQPLISNAKPQSVDPGTFVFDDVNVFISPSAQEDQP